MAPNDLKTAPWRMSVPTAVFGIEAEEQDQHRRHQRAAAHPGHADEHADQQAREAELPGHARGGSGQETNGRPRSRQPSLYASQPVQKPVIAASSARAATRMPSPAPSVGQAGGVRDRRGREHDEPDDVRGARRARVLERPFAEARLDHLEVENARQAVAPPERRARRRAAVRAAQAATTSRSATASTETTPITAWFVRGARESITCVSR